MSPHEAHILASAKVSFQFNCELLTLPVADGGVFVETGNYLVKLSVKK